MPESILAGAKRTQFSHLVALFALLLTGCGLAMNNEDRLNRAEAAIENSDFRAAIIDTKDVLRREPDNLRGRLLLGQASIAVGDGAAAEKEYQRAVELGAPFEDIAIDIARSLALQNKYQELLDQVPVDLARTQEDAVMLRQLYGGAYLGLGQPARARDSFVSVLDLNPDNVAAKLGVVASYEAEQNLAQARSTLDEIVTAHPGSISAWLASGALNLRVGGVERAEANFEVALKLAEEQGDGGSLVPALTGLTESVLAQNENDRARELVARLLSEAPDNLHVILLDARIAYIDKEWSRAQQNLQRILQVVPEHRAAQALLGAVHLESGNLSQAEMYLSAAMAAMPDNAEVRRMLAQTRILARELDAAQATLQPIIADSSADIRSLSMAATASAGMGEFDEAIGYLERSLEASPDNEELLFQLAATYLSAGRTEEAERVLNQIQVGNTADAAFRRSALLVSTKLRSGDIEGAVTEARLSIEKWPDDPRAYQLLGAVELSQSNHNAARENFEKGAELSPGSIESRRYMATLEEKEGNYSAARDHYLAILDEQPNATWAMFSLARIYANQNDVDETRSWLEKVRAADASAMAPRVFLARIYIIERNFDSAKAVIDEALAVTDSNPELHNLLGIVYVGEEEFHPAVASFQRATEIDASNVEYRLNLARSERQLGNNARAMAILEDSLDQSLSHLPSAVAIAWMKADDGDLDGAMEVVTRIQSIHPQSPVPHALEAELYAKDGDLIKASASYDRALGIEILRYHALRAHAIKNTVGLPDKRDPLQEYLALRPLDSEVRMVLAESYRLDEDVRQSIIEYDRILSAEPANGVALNNLAWVYFVAGDERAEQTARKALELMPSNGAVADTLGWILANQGSVDSGIELLREADRLTNGRAEIRYHLASEARVLLEQILSTDETFASRDEAQRLLKQLQ